MFHVKLVKEILVNFLKLKIYRSKLHVKYVNCNNNSRLF